MTDTGINTRSSDTLQGRLEYAYLFFNALFVIAVAAGKMCKAPFERDEILVILKIRKIIRIETVSSKTGIDLNMYSRSLSGKLMDIEQLGDLILISQGNNDVMRYHHQQFAEIGNRSQHKDVSLAALSSQCNGFAGRCNGIQKIKKTIFLFLILAISF